VELAWSGCDAVLADFASQNNLPPTASPASWERLTGAYPASIRFDSVGNNGRFLYSAEILRDLPLAMSAERFQRYLTETSGNDVEACRLYTWNAAISSAFYGPLQALEVTLRNAAHDKLRHHLGGQWFRNASVLDGDELRMAQDAELKLQEHGQTPTPGKIVAELGFGYWVGLFANRYDERLWRTYLCRAFLPRPSRRDLYDDLDRLRTWRNRIAHHEAVYQRRLSDDYQRVEKVIRGLSPSTWLWVDHHSRVPEVLAQRPEEVMAF